MKISQNVHVYLQPPKNDVLARVPGHEVGLLQVLSLDDRDLEPTVEHGDRVGGFD